MNRKDRRRQSKIKGTQAVRGGGGVSSFLLGNAGVAGGQQGPASDSLEDRQNMGERLHRAGKLGEARQQYESVLAQQPEHPRALAMTGLLAHQRGDHKEAVRLIQRSLKADPSNPVAHNALGNALRRLGRTEAAIESFERAVELDPSFAGALNNLGLACRQSGDLEAAAKWFRRALERDPEMAEAWSGLARTGRAVFRDDEVDQASRVAQSQRLSPADRRHLHYALGKHLDEIGEYDAAFDQFERANRLRESDIDDQSLISRIEAAAGVIPGSAVDPASGDPAPIFIFGMPRSGTTLVEQILASHPAVEGGGETGIVDREVVKWLNGRPAAALAQMTAGELASLRRVFMRTFAGRAAGKTHVTDKSPLSFMYLGVIARAFPEARLVHCKRQARDTCLSIYFTDFSTAYGFTTDIAAIGRVYKAYEEAMEVWSRIGEPAFHQVGYEDMVDDQEARSRALIEACGLDWNDSCLRFFENDRHVATPSDWQVHQPIFGSSRDRAARYEAHLKPLQKALNRG